jgi:hypothetical protein
MALDAYLGVTSTKALIMVGKEAHHGAGKFWFRLTIENLKLQCSRIIDLKYLYSCFDYFKTLIYRNTSTVLIGV